MSPKKKTTDNEPQIVREHPYIPDTATELFGKPILWLEDDDFIDWSMEADPNDGNSSKYTERYRGKVVVKQAPKDAEWVENPIYFFEDGMSNNTLTRELIESYLDEIRDLKKAVTQLDKAKGEVQRLQEKRLEQDQEIETRNEQLKEMEELCRAQQADLEYWQAEAGKTPDSTSDSLHAAIGGSPKEVQIKW